MDRVVDGDTLDLTVQLGMRISAKDRFRLWHPGGRFDAPEVTGDSRESGIRATDFVVDWLDENGPVLYVCTHKDLRGGFGRWLADIVSPDGRSLTSDMISAGHAKLNPS